MRVYLATYKPTGTPYAIRVYDKAAIWSENGVNEAREEFSIIKGINHARTLRLLCNFTDEVSRGLQLRSPWRVPAAAVS